MSDDYYHTCVICGKRYYRKYASDYPEDYWWLSISSSVGGVCSEACARETPKYITDKRKVAGFFQSLTKEQQTIFEDVWDILHYSYDGYETYNLMSGDIPEEKVYCFTCGKIFNVSGTEDVGGKRQCIACRDAESEL